MCVCVCVYLKRFVRSNWLMRLYMYAKSKIFRVGWQDRDPGELMLQFQFRGHLLKNQEEPVLHVNSKSHLLEDSLLLKKTVIFFFFQTFHWLNEPNILDKANYLKFTNINVNLIQNLSASQKPRIIFIQISRHTVAQLNWHVKLTITVILRLILTIWLNLVFWDQHESNVTRVNSKTSQIQAYWSHPEKRATASQSLIRRPHTSYFNRENLIFASDWGTEKAKILP